MNTTKTILLCGLMFIATIAASATNTNSATLSESAEQGVADAQFALGLSDEWTKGEDSIDEAGEWPREAEKQDYSEANRMLRNRRILFFVGWPILLLASIFGNTLGGIVKAFLFQRNKSKTATDKFKCSGKWKTAIGLVIKTIGATVVAFCCYRLVIMWTASPSAGLLTAALLFCVLTRWWSILCLLWLLIYFGC